MLKCDFCSQKWVYRIRSVGEGKFACSKCLSGNSERSTPLMVETEFVPEVGFVSKARLREMERRAILPYEVSKKDQAKGINYYLGRRMENGKICEDREPSY